MAKPQPWSPGDATTEIRAMARSGKLVLSYTEHFRQRLSERDLLIGDVLYVLKNGFVYDGPDQATQDGLHKYRMETRTPNSNNRVVRVVVIPDPSKYWAKIVAVMWVDE